MRISYIGIGEMGVGMARNILGKNGSLVIWNRTRDKPHVKSLAEEGAVLAETPEDAAAQSEFICVNLTADAAVNAVVSRIAPHVKPGSILLDFSTISPETAKSLYDMMLRHDAHYLDCPVSGGSSGASAGTLTIMVGGGEAAFEKAGPIFGMCGVNIQYMGPSGMGQKAKLINQLLTWVNQATVCEAMLLAEKSGINTRSLYKALLTSWGRSWMLERSVEKYIIPRDFDSPSGVELMVKDFNLIIGMAERAGCGIPIAKAAKRPYDAAMERGLAKKDPSVIIEVMAETNTPQ
ncbi:MAG: NAD(P)-dependent oxidoreductase [Synergistaceae bacterium]|nr:NAD(P)-dependent oxidoreductase [Synergistaceae bacterium]